VQIQRTVRRGRYSDGRATPGGKAFAIADGEHGVVEQYRRALDAAERSIYIEDQTIGSPEIVDCLHAALDRGVDVGFLVPANPHQEMTEARKKAESKVFFDSLAELGRHDHFVLAGIAASQIGGGYQNVYIHAKIALVDDAWCTIGSTNIGNRSFYGDTELNASFWHGPTVLALRVALLREHLGQDTTQLDDRTAFRLYREIARENAARRERGEKLEGLAFALDPTTYAS